MDDTLSKMLKKYVEIFLNEYSEFLTKEQLEFLKNINYQKIINFQETTMPFGEIIFGKIYLSNASNQLINNLEHMDGYNSSHYPLDNNSISSYLKYMCDNGYHLKEYYSDILMYFVFFLVIKNDSGFIKGLINQEIAFLKIKYNLKSMNLYVKEERIVSMITPIFKIQSLRTIMFMDQTSAFKYLNDHFGFRYANLVNEVSSLIDDKRKNYLNKNYIGLEGMLNYVDDYDAIKYGEVYNYLLDFDVNNDINYHL